MCDPVFKTRIYSRSWQTTSLDCPGPPQVNRQGPGKITNNCIKMYEIQDNPLFLLVKRRRFLVLRPLRPIFRCTLSSNLVWSRWVLCINKTPVTLFNTVLILCFYHYVIDHLFFCTPFFPYGVLRSLFWRLSCIPCWLYWIFLYKHILAYSRPCVKFLNLK